MEANLELPPVSADDLHRYLLTAYRVGNWARHRYVNGLLALHESRRGDPERENLVDSDYSVMQSTLQ